MIYFGRMPKRGREGIKIYAGMGRAFRQRTVTVALGFLLAYCPCVFALAPSLDASQYTHTAWRVREGFSKGVIFSIAQTSDGYLWLGTEFGLLRFDGVRNTAWRPPAGERLPSNDVRSLHVARDGRLWIGTVLGLASWKDGQLTHYPELDGKIVESLLEDHEGTVWVGVSAPPIGRLCKIPSGRTQCYGEDGRFGAGVTALYEDSGGNIWAGGRRGLWRWAPDRPKLYPLPDPMPRINALIEDDGGGLLIATDSGISRLKNGKFEVYPMPAGLQFRPYNFLRDRHGGLWIGAAVDSGLMHVHDGRTDLFTPSDGLTSDSVASLFEDREGNIWVSTAGGLDRFREPAILTISVKQGLSSRGLDSVLATRDGSILLGTSDGLNRWKNGELTIYGGQGASNRVEEHQHRLGTRSADRNSRPINTVRAITGTGLPEAVVYSMFEDKHGRIFVATARGFGILDSERFTPVKSLPGGVVYAITGDNAGNIWISHADSLFRLVGATVVERIPWSQLGRTDVATALVSDNKRNGLWLGFRQGGVAFFENGQRVTAYVERGGIVNDLRVGPRGALWAATQGGLTRIKDGQVATLTQKNGLPCDAVQWTADDGIGGFWLNMPCGLVRIDKSELDAWAADPTRKVPVTVLDSSDGVLSHSYSGNCNPRVGKSADGRLWFLPADGVSVLDPRHLPVNKLAPPVHIEEISADRKTYWQNSYGDTASSPPRLPPLVRDLTIDYTALSLVVPEKVQFRVKLEGQDKDWRELVNVRHVEYTNLPPKHYRFRVLACNNSGVWNEEGATLDFVIPPAWYQTNWFYALCAATFLALLWAAYRLRVRQLAAQFNMRLEERVAERTRIARDLHDTLLQSFQALLIRFQAGINMLAQRPVDARRVLEDAVGRASQAIAEGRDAIGDLRMSTVEKNDLAVAIKTIAEELARAQDNQDSTPFQVLVEGTPRELHPILRDEVYRLVTEALRNSFRHAAAENVEVEIRYDEKYFRVRVRDDGKGIPSDVLRGDGREGHYGLHGMRERAKLVGGKLTIWTELDSGTEIELIIPGARAYVKSTRPFWYFGKRSATETDKKETIERE